MKIKCRTLIFVILIFLISSITVLSQNLLLKDQQLLITMGNSITELGEKPDGYVSIMRKVLDTLYPEKTIYIVNVGISGHKSTDMNDRFERDVLQYKPDWLTISVGVNDVWHEFIGKRRNRTDIKGVPLPLFKEKVAGMVKRAQSAGTNVALFTATVIKEDLSSPENRKLAEYNNALRKIAAKYKCLLIDMDEASRNVLKPKQSKDMSDRGVLTYDGVHMLPSGNWLMAETALKAFGVSGERITLIKSRIEELINVEKQNSEKNLGRYQEVNFEVGLPREEEKRVVFYGSSSVDGWNLANDFPTIPLLNRGIGGETTRQMVMRFRQDVLILKPCAAIIFFGSCNDFWEHNKMSTVETKSNIIKMARLAKSKNIKLAFGAVSPVNDYLPGKDYVTSHPIDEVNALNQWISTFCENNGYLYIDFYSVVADSNGKLVAEFTDDGMHCNAKGYARWKPLVVQALKELGAWKE